MMITDYEPFYDSLRYFFDEAMSWSNGCVIMKHSMSEPRPENMVAHVDQWILQNYPQMYEMGWRAAEKDEWRIKVVKTNKSDK